MLGKRGSIILFLRGLPQSLTRKELKTFVQRTLGEMGPRPRSLKAAISTCSIVRITDLADGSSELHGMVEVQPATAAIWAIEQLNGREIKGMAIEVRRYHHRSLLRDRRRDLDSRLSDENRMRERRRKNLKIELLSA